MALYSGPIVDVDIHHRAANSAEVVKFMPKRWRDYVNGDGRGLLTIEPPGAFGYMMPNDARRADTWGPKGELPGTSYEVLREQLLDKHGYWRGVLTHDVGPYGTLLNPWFAEAVCQAVNDWNVSTWLTYDERLYGLAIVPLGDSERAVAEIHRMAKQDHIVGLLFCGNPTGRPLGDSHFDPIWKACAEVGWVVSLHPASSDRPGGMLSAAGGGKTYPVWFSQYSQQAEGYVSSLITHGTFEKFPSLKFVIKEYGVAWLPYVMWRLDQDYDLLRHESPWVKRWPSEYIRAHVKVSTQPFEESADGKGVVAEFLSTVDGFEDMMCFSTDYPHYSMDDPTYVARLLPTAWHSKVFCENACVSYGWKAPVVVGTAAG